jgi:hypothetical protein
MKRITLCVMVLLAVAGIAAAQTAGTKAAATQTQTIVKIEGKLALINGAIGVQVKEKSYYLAMPQYLFGFIDGLKEGAQVKLEGYEYSNARTPEYVQFRVTKLSFNGKDYDLTNSGGYGMGRMMDGRGDGSDDFGPGRGDTQGQGMGTGRMGNRR